MSLTRAQKRERQQQYNRRSRERKARRRALLESSSVLLDGPAPEDPSARILHHLAGCGDAGALRVWAIVADTLEACGNEVDLRAAEMIAATHDY